MNKQHSLTITAALLILFAAFTRLFPHYPNFTAIGAIAIFGGSVIKDKKLAFILPLAALLLADICLQLFNVTQGFYGGQLFVYIGFIIITWLAGYIRKPGVVNITLAAIWAGVIFFLVSNFGTWAFGDHLYPKTFSGLMSCYLLALPFYNNEFFGSFFFNTIFSNLFYSAVLFGIYYPISKALKTSRAYT